MYTRGRAQELEASSSKMNFFSGAMKEITIHLTKVIDEHVSLKLLQKLMTAELRRMVLMLFPMTSSRLLIRRLKFG